MMSLRRAAFLFLAPVLALAGLSGRPTRAQAPLLEFNYGIPSANHASVYVAQDLNLFEKAGLKPTFYYFQSGAPILAGLKGESLDVVTSGIALAFALGQGIPLKFIFWEANSSTSEGLVVDPAAGIKSFADIGRARKIGAAVGTCAQAALYVMAKKAGIEYSSLNVVNIPAPLFRNAFLSHSIDAGVAWPPFALQLQSEGFPVVAFDADYTPPGGICPGLTAVRPAFLKEHPEIGLKLVQVEAMARQAIANNPELAVSAYVRRLGVSPEVAREVVRRECCGGIPTFAMQLDPTSPFSLTNKDGGLAATLALATEALHAVKAVPAAIPLATLQEAIDPSYLQAYAASLPK